MRADLTSLGLGYFVANSDTVGRGLRALREFLHVHDQGAAPFLFEEDGIAMLGYEMLDPAIAGAEQMTFGALAIAANILRTLCGPGFKLRAVTSSEMTIVEVAARLGYSDSSTFTRAFRRWSGTSPALWRRRKTAATAHSLGTTAGSPTTEAEGVVNSGSGPRRSCGPGARVLR